MRRESSTVVVLVGEVGDGLMAGLGRSPNVSVARAPAAGAGQPAAEESAAARPGWEAGALAMREAARRRSTYVIVPDDPLADVAAAWRAMWDISGGSRGAAGFEQRAADALAAWQDKRFELPDYYLVMAAAQPSGTGPDLYLGPLRAARPRRVAVIPAAAGRRHPTDLLLGGHHYRACRDGLEAAGAAVRDSRPHPERDAGGPGLADRPSAAKHAAPRLRTCSGPRLVPGSCEHRCECFRQLPAAEQSRTACRVTSRT